MFEWFLEEGLVFEKADAILKFCRKLGTNIAVVTQEKLPFSFFDNLPHYYLPQGENNKSRQQKEALEDFLFAHNFNKDSCLIAIGGGVVTDITGFTAATFCRGISYVNIPTTYLAMTDAAISGKTGINTFHGKNLIGAFYPPQAVFIDPRFLQTLAKKQKLDGYIETLKHALIGDAALFSLLQQQKYSPEILKRSIEVKLKIITKDFYEKKERIALNFGHTIGHAIEYVSAYKISHGHAVALGIIAECYLSYKLGRLDWHEMGKIFKSANVYPQNIFLTAEDILHVIKRDKKQRKNKILLPLINKIGEVEIIEYKQGFEEAVFWLLENVLHADICRRY